MLHKGRAVLWALALFYTLAPCYSDGNIGCLFSAPLCVEGVEWCYDDSAFGRCIPIFNEEPEDGLLYQYDMSNDQLQWFEEELQALVTRGYRWDHAYTQCVLQAMLYSLRSDVVPIDVNTNICDQFSDPKLDTIIPEDEAAEPNMNPEETAYIRFTPNSDISESNYANEIYIPPMTNDITNGDLQSGPDILSISDNNNPQDIEEVILMREDNSVPVVIPFTGFRERIQEEDRTKQKKSIPEDIILTREEDERLGAHYRKQKTKPVLPFTAEYLTGNRFSPLDAEVRSNALEKYRQSFAAKNFPFEYENPDNEIPESRVYVDEDGVDSFTMDAGSGEIDPSHLKDLNGKTQLSDKNMEKLMKYIKSKLNPGGELYAEGGPLRSEDVQGGNYIPEDLQGFLYNEWGFMRRERDDVKKPGPRIDAKVLKFLYNKNVTDQLAKGKKQNVLHSKHDHNEFQHDPSYTYVIFKNRFGTDWEKGIDFISKLEALLGLEKNTFTNPRVALDEVTFKVEKNNKGMSADDVARKVVEVEEELRRQTGGIIMATGVGDRSKRPVIHETGLSNSEIFGIELPVFLALVGSLTVLIAGSTTFAILLRKDMKAKRKMEGLASATEIDTEATRDYQELCRARMWGKNGPQPTNEPRGASLTREPEAGTRSSRSSTSSWSEEPTLTNMDISTGHMVLAYMEDHLRNKDRLEQEWRALCAYEAEPASCSAAMKPENQSKNRFADVLPYDHSRVTLNALSNQNGSDYINASTITDHDPRNPAYILAAGPLLQSAADFWQMVWEQGAVVQVMLTRLTENGVQLCHRYWPEEGSQLYHHYEVHLVSEHIWCDDYLVRSFYLKNQQTSETRTVTQFHFLSWPENGVPSSTKALLEFRRKVNKSYRGRSCPIVVHCSDGAGRSGTYCLIDMVLNRMAKGAKEIDIAATLEHIRDQRPRTVATKQQFEFVLMAVAEEVHAILKSLPAHLQQMQEKKDKEKCDTDKEK